ncbi:MAG: hypothetical protein UR47_C0014G0027 [candidate division WS6 bacterium GW2011_GWB1_33_6]|uniref:LiaF transmembrane domain-containing protein n=2 Tax=Candidatus Dojkabacteria TaxID=74243 RepID=A0A0G0CU01_9BACT|nr:MAG: hypothetical protein UR47_C0014G0027 [candidate division WS6 bacterium GW2011_GWB1_33_6]MBS3145219.1 hypothetical protein [Candidatus Woesearchaeota archaeon]HBB64433.1 hypothetical protein [Patescibacteria group bacterium]
MKDNSKFIFGVFLVFLGLIFLMDQTGIFSPFRVSLWSIIWKFWPLVLIFLGTKFLLEKNFTPGIVILVLGTVFLATNLFSWNFFSVLWPVIIIAIGISMLIKKDIPVKKEGKYSSEDYVNETAIFWGVDKKVNSKNFKGGELNVAFGGIGLDLREAKVAKEGAKLHVNCAFGGVEIFVPKNCRVITKGTGVFGGWEPKVEESEVTEPVLEITGGVVFGGVEIK